MPRIERLIREGRVGGVILFAGDIASAAQARALTRDLQSLAADAGLPPLWISVDQDGGIINRIVADFPVFPSAMAITETGSWSQAWLVGRTGRHVVRREAYNNEQTRPRI
jgi:beta-N-acetylhexosaminidase